MPFAPIDDIPDIESSGVHVKKLDVTMSRVVEDVRFAVRKPSNLKSHSKDDKDLIQLLRSQLLVFLTTHESIRRLFRNAHREENYPPVADGISLVREQVEKIFTVALLLQNPTKWIKIYLRNDYRTRYEGWLLRNEELGHLPRHQKHLKRDFPAFLEQYRTAPSSIQADREVLVSKFAVRALEHYWNNPGVMKPAWFQSRMKRGRRKRGFREYITNYFEFPTPGKAARRIINAPQRKFLYRWHKEYQYLCSYTHVALGKIALQTIAEIKHREATEMLKSVGQRQMERALFTSYTATASACALVINRVTKDYGAKTELREFWKQLDNSSLLARPFWIMYVRDILS